MAAAAVVPDSGAGRKAARDGPHPQRERRAARRPVRPDTGDPRPEIPDCEGRCWTSCGPIDMSDRKRQRIRAAGVRITPYRQAMADVEGFWCDALTGDKRCAVYELRPLICRIWGRWRACRACTGTSPKGAAAVRHGRLPDDRRVDADRRRRARGRRGGGGRRGDGARGVRAEVERIRARGRVGERRRAQESVPAAFRRRPG